MHEWSQRLGTGKRKENRFYRLVIDWSRKSPIHSVDALFAAYFSWVNYAFAF